MHPPQNSSPSLRTLFVAWSMLTRSMMRAIAGKFDDARERSADGVKDFLMDLGSGSSSGDPAESSEPSSLPPVNSEQLAESMQASIEAVLRLTAEAINEEAVGDCLEAEMHEQVLALFEELAHETLDRALDL